MRSSLRIRLLWLLVAAAFSSALALPAAAAAPATPPGVPRPSVCPATIPNCPITVGMGPKGDAVDPVHQKVYVANFNSQSVSVIEVNTNTVVPIGPSIQFNRPNFVAVNFQANLVYVTDAGAAPGSPTGTGFVTVIDGATDTILALVLVGFSPQGIAVDQTTGLVYVANRFSNSVSVITGGTNPRVTTTITDSSFNIPTGVAVNSQTHQVFVTNFGDNSVSVIDGLSNQVVRTIPVGPEPVTVAVNTRTNVLYVVNQGNSTLSVLLAHTPFTTIATPQLAGGMGLLEGVAVNEQLNHIYVMDTANNTVIVLVGTAAQALLATLPAGPGPFFAAVDSASGRVYVTDNGDASVTVIQDRQS